MDGTWNVENPARCLVTSVSYFENLEVMGIKCVSA